MLTHVNSSVAVSEEKSGQIWPQKGPLGALFRPNLAGYRALGPHPAPCGQVLGGFDTLRGYFEFFLLYVGDALKHVRGLWSR